MKIYHGTTATIARRALTEGLKPRKLTGKSNWKHSVESHPSQIYLTTTYAPYFALQAVKERKGAKIGILEIETDFLDETKLRPDEDFIEQAMGGDRGKSAGIKGKTVSERTKYIHNHIDEFANAWKLSVEHLGNCAYKGVIKKGAITKVVVVDTAKCAAMCFEAIEPVITLMNYKFCRAQFQLLNRWFMGERVAVEELFQSQSVNPLNFSDDKQKATIIKKMTQNLSNQNGIKIIFPK